ncbi:hypothetical protein B0H10DRAFT_1956699 [Mycena sp. CBHHK59/15]|nr:hypothetical protein B0H10DRAFT_1956699 [Mycena sp. CBHHK59/15]
MTVMWIEKLIKELENNTKQCEDEQEATCEMSRIVQKSGTDMVDNSQHTSNDRNIEGGEREKHRSKPSVLAKGLALEILDHKDSTITADRTANEIFTSMQSFKKIEEKERKERRQMSNNRGMRIQQAKNSMSTLIFGVDVIVPAGRKHQGPLEDSTNAGAW